MTTIIKYFRRSVGMDSKDSAILAELLADSRQSTALIARKTGIPRATVHERIQRFREKGLIRRFTAELDHSLLGRPTTAFVLVGLSPSSESASRSIAKKVLSVNGVGEARLVAGEWDLIVKARAASLEELSFSVVGRIRGIKGVSRTLTLPVLKGRRG